MKYIKQPKRHIVLDDFECEGSYLFSFSGDHPLHLCTARFYEILRDYANFGIE